MAKIKVLAGDIGNGDWTVIHNLAAFEIILPADVKGLGFFAGIKAAMTPTKIVLKGGIASVETMSEEQIKSAVGAGLWGAAGAVLLGPLGLLAGVLAGGNRKEVVFSCTLKDGRKFLASSDQRTFTAFQAEAF